MRVAVAMSGGMDSTAVALFLKREGHDVTGLHTAPALAIRQFLDISAKSHAGDRHSHSLGGFVSGVFPASRKALSGKV